MASKQADKLTPKQEKFCQVYIETGNASEAYRQAYNTENMKPETVNRNAKALMDNSKIATRVNTLMQTLVERHNVTVDSLTNELEEHRLLAVTAKQLSAANQASMGKAKLHGFSTEDRPNARRPYGEMSDDELDSRIFELSGTQTGKAASAGSGKGGNGKTKPH